jgi:hypothetical protein
MRRQWVGLVVAALAACGGTTAAPENGADGGAHDAQGDGTSGGDGAVIGDASDDAAAYLACMNDNGQLDGSLKSCHADTDCVIKQEDTDCCGAILYVGVSAASASKFDACEASWLAHFPPCGCASNQTATEDGHMGRQGDDGGAPQVHCIDFTSNGGVCMTYTP